MPLSQSPPRAGFGRAGIYGALGIGFLAAAVLTWIAWGPLIQTDQVGKQRLENLRLQAEENVRRSWDKLLSDTALIDEVLKPDWQLELSLESWNAAFAEPPGNDEWLASKKAANPSFDLLFAESERHELEIGDIEEAISACRDAIALEPAPDPVRLAGAKFRLLQLLLKADDDAAAIEVWRELIREHDGRQVVDGYSTLALGFLAIGYGCDEVPDDVIQETSAALSAAFGEQRIHLPLLSIRFQSMEGRAQVATVVDMDSRILHERLVNCPVITDSLKASINDHFSTQFVRSLFSNRAQVELAPGLNLIADESKVIAIMHEPLSEVVRIDAWRLPEFGQLATTFWREEKALPDGFDIELYPGFLAPESELRSTIALSRSAFRARVWASKPEQIYQQATRPVTLMRWGFTLLGLLCAVTGIAIYRALERQRKLQQLKTEFVASVSHELRTPVSSILLMAENLEHGRIEEADSVACYHQLIKREAQRLRRLIADILDFSRMDRGRSPAMNFMGTDLGQWHQDLKSELQQWAADHNTKLKLHGEVQSTPAQVDPDALRRAILNLADNGLRHSGSDQFEVSFQLAKNKLNIEFRDHGSGLVPGSEEAIFKPFHQSESKSVKGKGAGLGLAIVSEIIRAHQGQVSAANADGGGAVFRVSIPISDQEIQNDPN